MNRLLSKRTNISRRANRVRTMVRGKSNRPRLSIVVSNRHISAQIIDDEKHTTLVAASTDTGTHKGTMTEKAASVGHDIGKKAKAKKIKTVSLDRGSRLYHGRVKAFADAVRSEGLEF